MMQEYYKWCELNPNATEEEKKEKWDYFFRLVQMRAALIDAFVSLRFQK